MAGTGVAAAGVSDVDWALGLVAEFAGHERERFARNLDRWLARDTILNYHPYWKQAWFHNLGRTKRERLFRAGNQLGKTFSAAQECAMHLTGIYPDWWKGMWFDKPITCWASGVTGVAVRNNAQTKLIGKVGRFGEGIIPSECLPMTRGTFGLARGTSDLLDFVLVKHASGGFSTLQLLYYSQEREKWQGPSVEVMWFDEEPPMPIYTEGLSRTNATGGIVLLSYTPLKGMSEVTERFLMQDNDARADVNMVIGDALRISPEQRRIIVEGYQPHERDARTKGIPTLKSGRVYPLADIDVKVKPFPVPDHWPRICGIDFGWDHPTAAVECAWDRDADCMYVLRTYRVREKTPAEHVITLKPWGPLPWAWPHDGAAHEKGSGIPMAQQYRDHDLDMLPEHAQMDPSGDDDTPTSLMSKEAGVMRLLVRMQEQRLKVFANCSDWFQEFRLYHRDEGKIVPKRDDLMDATRYAEMCLPFARTRHGGADRNNRRDYDWQAGI